MKVYIAGPMSNMPDLNYPAFHAAARDLTTAGFTPINPARTEGREDCRTWVDFMRAALRDIADADGIALLDGWQTSRGAFVEQRLGIDLDLDVRPLAAWLTPATDTPGRTLR